MPQVILVVECTSVFDVALQPQHAMGAIVCRHTAHMR